MEGTNFIYKSVALSRELLLLIVGQHLHHLTEALAALGLRT